MFYCLRKPFFFKVYHVGLYSIFTSKEGSHGVRVRVALVINYLTTH